MAKSPKSKTAKKAKKFRIAVRDFALPVPRTGSIEAHSGYGPLPQIGIEIHQKIQSQKALHDVTYRREMALSWTFEVGAYLFEVSGRLDGLFEKEEPLLEEIKTSFNIKDLQRKLKQSNDHPYILQLLTYAYIFYKKNGRVPLCQLLLVSSRTEEQEVLPVLLDVATFEAWLTLRLKDLVSEIEEREALVKRRKKLAEKLAFPFYEPRSGQIELMQKVEKEIEEGKKDDKRGRHIIIQAPTGLGKTVGVTFPTLKDSLKRGVQSFYVTPKNSQHEVARDAAFRLRFEGEELRSLVITAKGKVCFKDEPFCDPSYCEFAKGYYTKLYKHELLKKLQKKKDLTAKDFIKIAEQYEVCPFELSLDMTSYVDLIICDYNYIFSPRSALQRLDAEEGRYDENPNLLIDEAHNLPERAKDYFSPALSTSVLEKMRGRILDLPGRFKRVGEELLNKAISIVKYHAPETEDSVSKITLNKRLFFDLDEQLTFLIASYLKELPDLGEEDVVLEFCRYWSSFCEALEFDGDEFFTTYRRAQYADKIKITCSDASRFLSEKMKGFANIIAFSATMKPFSYYASLSGYHRDILKTYEFSSPFPKENRKILVIPQVSTKYKDRNQNYARIGDAVSRIVSVKPGNYFAFFPSFEFLEKTATFIVPGCLDLLKQTPNMSQRDCQDIINSLKKEGKNHLVLAVQGGMFSEGLDYPGDMLIGAIIVGPPLPTFDLERELIKEYYEKVFGQGFDYAYVYPAMAKAVQSAGRVIRSESDRGLIVLMDQRFLHDAYTKAMPSDWFSESPLELVSSKIITEIKDFWGHEGAL